MRLVPAVLTAALAVFAVTADALAGQITSATGPIKVNGKTATLPVTLAKGDTVDTEGSNATFKSDAGDTITIEKGSKARSDGVEAGIEYLFIVSGSAVGSISSKTTFGVAAGWASVEEGKRADVRVEAPSDKAATEGRFRTLKGENAWIRNAGYAVWLPEAHSVTLWSEKTKKGAMCFRTSQQNEGRVEINKQVSGGNIRIEVPRATTGCVEDWAGNKTKISNDLTSNKQEKIHVVTEFGQNVAADVGPNTFALIDNQTGSIEIVEEIIDDQVGEELPNFDASEDDPSLSRKRKR